MGFKSLSPRAVTLLMAACGSHESERLIALAQMLQISEVIIMALAYESSHNPLEDMRRN